MTNEIIIASIINITLFYLLWFFLFKDYFVDSHRHELFVLRDQLFDYAVENNIPMNNPAFLLRWHEINSMIKYAHETHLIFLSSLFVVAKKDDRNNAQKYLNLKKKKLKTLAEKDYEFFMKNEEEQTKLFISFVIKSSLVYLFLTFLLAIILAIVGVMIMIIKKVSILGKVKNSVGDIYNNYQYTVVHSS